MTSRSAQRTRTRTMQRQVQRTRQQMRKQQRQMQRTQQRMRKQQRQMQRSRRGGSYPDDMQAWCKPDPSAYPCPDWIAAGKPNNFN